MALQIDALYEDGVFVPVTRPRLADRARVVLTVDAAKNMAARPEQYPEQGGRAPSDERSGCDLAIAMDFHPDGC
jgi:hypothetical protein